MSSEQNTDQQELEKFDALAQQWWDPDGELRTLHHINPARLSYLKQRQPLRGQRILDIGCGGGLLCEALHAEGAKVTGIDLAAQALEAAKQHAQAQGLAIDYQLQSAEALAEQAPAQYDIVTCLEMLEHVPEPHSVVSAAARLVKPGGSVFFSTINRTQKARWLAITAAEKWLKLVPEGTHEFDKLIKPSELDAYCRHAGLHLEHLSGLEYNPLSQRAKLCRSLDINYLAHARRYEH